MSYRASLYQSRGPALWLPLLTAIMVAVFVYLALPVPGTYSVLRNLILSAALEMAVNSPIS